MKNEESSWGLVNFVAVIILGAILIIGGSLVGSKVSQRQSEKSIAGLLNEFKSQIQKVVNYEGVEGKTALELLQASHEVNVQDSSIGSFVTSIDGDENTNDTYWMIYVNDQLSPVGPADYVSKDGDKIEWRYEKLQ